jgi:hypothetical protein
VSAVLGAREVRARRLVRHGLTATVDEPTPAGVVVAMHGAQAQVASAAELSVALRMPGATRTTVREALADGSLTRTFGPRGTIHLLPTRDLATWLGALGAVPAGSSFTEEVRLSPAQTEAVVAAVGEALLARGELTLAELDEEVAARAGAWAGDLVMPAFQGFWPRWRQAVGRAAHAGVLVFGAGRGRQVTYTHPGRRDPGFRPLPPDQALPRFVHGYLHAFGPATPDDLARWLNAPPAWTRGLFDTDRVERVDVDGREGWVNAGDTAPTALGRSVRLLPYFDALPIGFQPREQLFPGRAWERALARGQAGNYPVLLVDGVVRGVWHHRRAGRYVDVTVETWADLSATRRRALHTQVDRVGEILEAVPRLTLGPVSVGPHA